MKTQTTFRDVNVRVHASKLKFALIFAFIFSVFQSQTYTFTGNGDGTSWTDAANWTGATGIPYIDDTTCSVNVGSFTVTIPSSTNLTMESGTVSGAGKIINNGTFTVISTGSKSFTLATFENKGTFSLGNGTDNNGTINMYNNTVFDNLVGASLIANGLSFSSSGGNTVKNAGVFRKLGEFSENFNVNFTNTGEISNAIKSPIMKSDAIAIMFDVFPSSSKACNLAANPLNLSSKVSVLLRSVSILV